MKRQLILHIGLTKTGTSSIQLLMGSKRRALLRRGVCYPRSIHKQLLPAALLQGEAPKSRRHRRTDGVTPAMKLERGLLEFDAEMNALPERITTVVLSSEHLSLYLRNETEIRQLQNLLTPYFEKIKVVVYLRRQDLHATSNYSQMLRRGNIVQPDLANLRPEFAALYDYAALLARWEAVFGRDNLVPRIFERQSLLKGDAVRDFVALCGIDEAFADKQRKVESNPSINAQGQALLLALGKHIEVKGGNEWLRSNLGIWPRLTSLATNLYAGKGWQPSRAEAAAFMATYAPGNEIVRQNYFPERETLFDMDFTPLPEHPVELHKMDVLPSALAAIIAETDRSMRSETALKVMEAQDLAQRGAMAEARKLLAKAVARDGTSVASRLELARLCADSGDSASALAYAQAALAVEPYNEHARVLLAQLSNTEQSVAEDDD